MTPRVLFISPGLEEYASDGLLHGLRALLGDRCVDWPKHEILYDTCPVATIRSIRGYGMGLYGLLEDIPINRARVWEELRYGEFDAVVFADVTNRFGAFLELLPYLGDTRAAAIDGYDAEAFYPYGGKWWRRRGWRALPRAHTRVTYFKRELTPKTTSYRYFRLVPTLLAGLLPRPALEPFSYSFPAEKIVDAPPPKDQLLASHVVDPEVAKLVGASSDDYHFDTEEAYYGDLRRSRFGVTTKRAGWDCLRHYEIAANGCVPCYRDLDQKPALCAPHGLDETNCVAYSDARALLARLEAMGESEYAALQAGALAWARSNSTVERARQLLTVLGLPAPSALVGANEDPIDVGHVA